MLTARVIGCSRVPEPPARMMPLIIVLARAASLRAGDFSGHVEREVPRQRVLPGRHGDAGGGQLAFDSALYLGRFARSSTDSSVIGSMSSGSPSCRAASAAISAQVVGPELTQWYRPGAARSVTSARVAAAMSVV